MARISTRELVMCIMNPDVPSPVILFTRSHKRVKFSFFRRRIAFLPLKNEKTHKAERNWEMIVARAAPRTPNLKRNMKTGSRMMFTTAPRTTVIMPILPNPWALMKWFIPRLIMTKMVPNR